MTKKEVREYLAEIGAKGGKIGGKATTPAKKAATRASLEKARKRRWPKRKKKKGNLGLDSKAALV